MLLPSALVDSDIHQSFRTSVVKDLRRPLRGEQSLGGQMHRDCVQMAAAPIIQPVELIVAEP